MKANILQIIAPLPLQFLQTEPSLGSVAAIAFNSELEMPEVFIRAKVEPKQVKHHRRDVDT